MVELCRAAWAPGRLAWYVSPSYKQSKRIVWKALKKMTEPYWATLPNETDLRIELASGGTICLRGADNYDSLRGDGLDFLVLDEYAQIAAAAWTEVLRPALADRQGRALFIGTPQGFNHFHELYERAEDLPDWKAFQFTTAEGGHVSPTELESAAQEMDERTYLQEFLAKFQTLGVGRAYYAFDRVHNVKNIAFSPELVPAMVTRLQHESALLGNNASLGGRGSGLGRAHLAGLKHVGSLRRVLESNRKVEHGIAVDYPGIRRFHCGATPHFGVAHGLADH